MRYWEKILKGRSVSESDYLRRSRVRGYAIHHIVDGIPWASFGRDTGVDLGGSHGDAHFTILRFINQDLPQVVARIPPLSSELEGLRPFINYDFFTPQPVKGANIMVIGWQFLRTRRCI